MRKSQPSSSRSCPRCRWASKSNCCCSYLCFLLVWCLSKLLDLLRVCETDSDSREKRPRLRSTYSSGRFDRFGWCYCYYWSSLLTRRTLLTRLTRRSSHSRLIWGVSSTWDASFAYNYHCLPHTRAVRVCVHNLKPNSRSSCACCEAKTSTRCLLSRSWYLHC